MEVICKEGMLYLQGFKFGKKTWRKVWMVLFKPSSSGVGRLEFCAGGDGGPLSEHAKSGRQKTAERKVVRLSDCLSVTPAPREACPAGCTAFYLNTKQCNYTFASTSSQDWTSALCLLAFQRDPGGSDKEELGGGTGFTMEDNDLYSSWKRDSTLPPNQYEVMVQSTEASKWCKLAGKYLVSTNKDDLVLSDISTGAVVYCWPYRLLRRFGQVEGGFSIEAGRRCESGEGIFTFLTRHGPQIFQAIAKQCLPKKEEGVHPLSVHRMSLPDVSPVVQPVDRLPVVPVPEERDVRDTNDGSECEYYTTSAPSSADSVKHLGLIQPGLSCSEEEVGEEGEDEEERCLSLEAANWRSNTEEDSTYYNLRRDTLPVLEENKTNDIYSFVSNDYIPSDPQPPKADQCGAFKNPNLPPADDCIHQGYDTQTVDDAKETEDGVGTSHAACCTEVPGSFKHRLAEIISKDLARFQPPPPPGVGSPTFFQP
ncbi:docking protein 3 [Austrofundulus limnaeus]|uniref:Docking protein 3 n=1 Tax=Austrofundulus limnaeus TaxID=52670 RepID=A0A2I4B1F1_AUSLI|nr:PREDICTED: docking protein 3 [Austrofundulus limnaeus]